MIAYCVPERFFEGQVLWCNVPFNGTEFMMLCQVLDVRQDKCEIKFLNSDNTCVWANKDQLAEIRQRLSH